MQQLRQELRSSTDLLNENIKNRLSSSKEDDSRKTEAKDNKKIMNVDDNKKQQKSELLRSSTELLNENIKNRLSSKEDDSRKADTKYKKGIYHVLFVIFTVVSIVLFLKFVLFGISSRFFAPVHPVLEVIFSPVYLAFTALFFAILFVCAVVFRNLSSTRDRAGVQNDASSSMSSSSDKSVGNLCAVVFRNLSSTRDRAGVQNDASYSMSSSSDKSVSNLLDRSLTDAEIENFIKSAIPEIDLFEGFYRDFLSKVGSNEEGLQSVFRVSSDIASSIKKSMGGKYRNCFNDYSEFVYKSSGRGSGSANCGGYTFQSSSFNGYNGSYLSKRNGLKGGLFNASNFVPNPKKPSDFHAFIRASRLSYVINMLNAVLSVKDPKIYIAPKFSVFSPVFSIYIMDQICMLEQSMNSGNLDLNAIKVLVKYKTLIDRMKQETGVLPGFFIKNSHNKPSDSNSTVSRFDKFIASCRLFDNDVSIQDGSNCKSFSEALELKSGDFAKLGCDQASCMEFINNIPERIKSARQDLISFMDEKIEQIMAGIPESQKVVAISNIEDRTKKELKVFDDVYLLAVNRRSEIIDVFRGMYQAINSNEEYHKLYEILEFVSQAFLHDLENSRNESCGDCSKHHLLFYPSVFSTGMDTRSFFTRVDDDYSKCYNITASLQFSRDVYEKVSPAEIKLVGCISFLKICDNDFVEKLKQLSIKLNSNDSHEEKLAACQDMLESFKCRKKQFDESKSLQQCDKKGISFGDEPGKVAMNIEDSSVDCMGSSQDIHTIG